MTHKFIFFQLVPETDIVGKQIVSIPIHPNLLDKDVERIIKSVNSFLEENISFAFFNFFSQYAQIILSKLNVNKYGKRSKLCKKTENPPNNTYFGIINFY